MARNRYDVDESLETPFNTKHLKRAFVYVKRYKKGMIIAFTLSVLAAILALLSPAVTRHVIDTVIPEKNITGVGMWALFLLFAIIINVVFTSLRSVIMTRVGQSIVFDIRSDLFRHMQYLPFSYYDNRPQGKILIRVVNYVNNVSDVLSNGLINLILELINVILILVFMFYIDVRLSLVILSGIPVTAFVLVAIRTRQRRAWQELSNKSSNMNAYLQESIGGIEITQLYNREVKNLGIFSNLTDEYRTTWLKAVRMNALFPFVIDNLMTIITMAIYAIGLLYLGLENVSLGVILAMGTYALRFWTPILNIANLYNSFVTALSYLERIFETLDEPLVISNREDAYDLPEIKGDVEFKGVSFGYDVGVPILEDVNFKVKSGQQIALVGPTGAGKTTIVNLLSRFYDKDLGQVLIDGHEIEDVTIHSLRGQMGIMMQDSFIFSGTIMDNIRYGKLDATDEDVMRVSRMVHAHDFIVSFERGYQTEVNESGAGLSEGQKQLIAMARTLLKDPKILILDEATSSIDTQTEKLVQAGLDVLIEGRTSFIIAHRLSTIKNSDQIFYISDRNISERGDHDSLLENKGHYYKLVNSKSKLD
ncbi:MAG: ABC transporter ATP-binding protein [Erysipelothrix sp.]|nr:ABC transporter ATP-binding protein [Erysipelothrix sp.]